MELENLDCDDADMRSALLNLPKDSREFKFLTLHDSRSRESLQGRVTRTADLLSALGYEVGAGRIDKLVNAQFGYVWRTVIQYKYEPYHFDPSS